MSGIEAVVGVVSAGAGLLSLAIQLSESIQKLKAFKERVKSSSETLQGLILDLETMGLCLDQVERYRCHDSEEARLISRCLERCCTATNRIEKVVDKMQNLNARFSHLGKFYTAFKEPEAMKVLAELEQAKSSLSMSLLIFYSEQQARRYESQCEVLQYQNTQLDLILAYTEANSFTLAQISDRSSEQCSRTSPDSPSLLYKSNHRRLVNREATTPVQQQRLSVQKKCPRVRRVTIQFPRWLCSQAWNLSAMRAQAGWNFNLRTYMVRHPDSEIFCRCIAGDTKAVQKMITQGAASIWDVASGHISYDRVLLIDINMLQIAIIYGHIDLYRYLFQRLHRHELDLSELILTLCCSTSSSTPVLEKLFEQEMDLDLDSASTTSMIHFQDLEEHSLKWIFDNQTTPLSWSAVIDMFSKFHGRGRFITCATFLGLFGIECSSPRLGALKKQGFSILHFAAAMLANAPKTIPVSSRPIQDWLNVAFTALRNGLEPSEVPPIHHRDNPSRRNLTHGSPFFDLVAKMSGWQTMGRHEPGRFLELVRAWLDMIQRAGLDLLDYGKQEDLSWRLCQHTALWFVPFKGQVCFHLTYGQLSEQWNVSISHVQLMPLFRVEKMPGAFKYNPNIEFLPKEVCWYPNKSDEDDHTWHQIGNKSVWCKPCPAPDIFSAYMKIYTRAESFVQDDGSVVGLMASRIRRATSRKPRSASVSPKRRSRRYEQSIYEWRCMLRYGAKTPRWNPGIHFCVDTMAWEYGDPHAGVRECANGVCNRTKPEAAQTSERWERFSFLAEIRNCIDGLPTSQGRLFSGFPSYFQHTGTKSCPHGCARIKLDELHVPEALQEHHPRRRTSELWDETELEPSGIDGS